MSEPGGIEAGTPEVSDTGPVDSQPAPVADYSPPSSGGHPAWQEILSQVPEALHERLTPVLKKWDDGVTERLSQVQSQYAGYRPFMDQGVQPQHIDAGLRLIQLMQSDPRTVYEYLAEQLGQQNSGQGQGNRDTVDLGEFGDEPQRDDPRFSQLERQQQQLMQVVQQQYEQEQVRQGDVWYSTRQAEITSKYPNIPLDWDYINNKASIDGQRNGGNFDAALDNAAKSYVELVGNAQRRQSGAPSVLPATGGVPSNHVNTKGMSGTDRRKYAVDLLNILDKDKEG